MLKNSIGIVLSLALLTSCGGTPPPTQEELRASAGDVHAFDPGEGAAQWGGCGLIEISDFENGFCVGQNIVFEYVNSLDGSTKPYEFYPIGSYILKNKSFNKKAIKVICDATLIPHVWEHDGGSVVFTYPKNTTEFKDGCNLGISRTFTLAINDYKTRHAQTETVTTPDCESSDSPVSCDDEYIANVENNGGYYASLGDRSSELNMATKFCEFLNNGTSVDEWMQMGMSAKPDDQEWMTFLSAIGAAALISYCPEFQDQALTN